MAKKQTELAELINTAAAWCTAHGWQCDTCRIPDMLSHNAENTATAGRDNAVVVWRAGVAPRTLLFRDALVMTERDFVYWLVGEQRKEVA